MNEDRLTCRTCPYAVELPRKEGGVELATCHVSVPVVVAGEPAFPVVALGKDFCPVHPDWDEKNHRPREPRVEPRRSCRSSLDWLDGAPIVCTRDPHGPATDSDPHEGGGFLWTDAGKAWEKNGADRSHPAVRSTDA